MSDLRIYKASAGSGKTFRITREYLRIIFNNPSDYRRVLAVTFTHKATAEMKTRILEEIGCLARGESSDHQNYLIDECKLNDVGIRERARVLLQKILHDYSRFYVGTIDSFFQSVLKSFTREIGLQGGYEVELDNIKVLNESVDMLLSDVDNNKNLKEWLINFAMEKIESGKSWKINSDLVKTGEELFKEGFSMVGKETIKKLNDKDFLKKYIGKLYAIERNFESSLKRIGKEAIDSMKSYGLEVTDFSNGKKGVAGYFEKLSYGEIKEPGKISRNVLDNPEKWHTQSSSRKEDILVAVNNKLNDLLRELISLYKVPYFEYNTAAIIRKQLYSLGIINDLSNRIQQYKKERGIVLLSETPVFLERIINNNDAPFIYEKTGDFLKHFIIDEFQDTSVLQWNNFRPLINDSLSNNNFSMLVGDVKQSIYRWRNSDWSLLGGKVQKEFKGRILEDPLRNNWRSLDNIIDFNNSFFASAVSFLQQNFNSELSENDHNNTLHDDLENRIQNAYEESFQFVPGNKRGGYARINFIETKDWKDEALKILPSQIEYLRNNGYSLGDITILARKKSEGKEIVKYLLEWKTKHKKEINYKFEIISNEALDLKYSNAVQIILQVMTYLTNPSDFFAVARLVINYNLKITPGNNSGETIFNRLTEIYLARLSKNKEDGQFEKDCLGQMKDLLPSAFYENYKWYRNLPLFEMVEQLISVFSLNKNKQDIPYLQGFQDCILDFTRRKTSDIQGFMNWWDAEGDKQLLKLPDNQDAIRIMTIHKSKGLGIKAVLIPFCDWKLENKGVQSDLIWCRPTTAPFDEIEILPLNYSENLGKSIFRNDYLNEKLQSWIDNINLLYVAFTRAKNELIISTPVKKPNKEGRINTVGDIFYGLFYHGHKTEAKNSSESMDIIDLTKGFDENAGLFEIGKPTVDKEDTTVKKDNKLTEIVFDKYPVYASYGKLRLKLGCDSYFRIEKNKISRNITIGKIKHELFEHIKTKNDIGKAVRKMIFDGKLDEKEGKDLKDQIVEAMNNPVISAWFEPGWEVKTESSILTPGGSEYRPDRVLIKENTAVVIDYKFTASQTGSHKKQVKNYMKYLEEMGFEKVDGYLWYVEHNSVEELIL